MAENTIQDTAREAEDVILDLKARGNGRLALTTSQIRKFLAAVNALTNKIDMFRTRGEKSDVLTPELAAGGQRSAWKRQGFCRKGTAETTAG